MQKFFYSFIPGLLLDIGGKFNCDMSDGRERRAGLGEGIIE